jgi:hypothetical protein
MGLLAVNFNEDTFFSILKRKYSAILGKLGFLGFLGGNKIFTQK